MLVLSGAGSMQPCFYNHNSLDLILLGLLHKVCLSSLSFSHLGSTSYCTWGRGWVKPLVLISIILGKHLQSSVRHKTVILTHLFSSKNSQKYYFATSHSATITAMTKHKMQTGSFCFLAIDIAVVCSLWKLTLQNIIHRLLSFYNALSLELSKGGVRGMKAEATEAVWMEKVKSGLLPLF